MSGEGILFILLALAFGAICLGIYLWAPKDPKGRKGDGGGGGVFLWGDGNGGDGGGAGGGGDGGGGGGG